MTDNSTYWSTIATVIPVIALAQITAWRRQGWHRLSTLQRRWTATYGALIAGLLAWSEYVSLHHLQSRSSTEFEENLTVLIVGTAAVRLLFAPVGPLLSIALYDMHPKIWKLRRAIWKRKRKAKAVRREYDALIASADEWILEAKIQGAEAVIRNPYLVFDDSGSVRPDYRDRVTSWRHAYDAREDIQTHVLRIEKKFRTIRKEQKKYEKAYGNAIRITTKRIAKAADPVDWGA